MVDQVPRMSKEELRERSGEIVILDVRSGKDWNAAELKIRGAWLEVGMYRPANRLPMSPAHAANSVDISASSKANKVFLSRPCSPPLSVVDFVVSVRNR